MLVHCSRRVRSIGAVWVLPHKELARFTDASIDGRQAACETRILEQRALLPFALFTRRTPVNANLNSYRTQRTPTSSKTLTYPSLNVYSIKSNARDQSAVIMQQHRITGTAGRTSKCTAPSTQPSPFATCLALARTCLSINVSRSLARRVNSSILDSIMVMTLEEFAASVKGAVYAPGSSGYEERRSKAAHYQRLIGNRTPALWVVIREAPGDIQLTLKYATEHGLACTVLAGGHSRFSVCDGRVVIDLSELKHHELDLERRRIRVAAGMSLAEVVDATAPHHFQAPLGVVSHTGLGLVLGGGIGWLSRLHGVSADSLVGLKAVAGNGELIALSRDDLVTAAEQSATADAIEPDQLFRAFKGAPGSFAVVYEMELQCYEVPEQPTVVMNAFQLTGDDEEHGRENMRRVRDFLARDDVEAERRGTLYMVLTNNDGVGVARVVSVFLGSVDEAKSFYAPILELPHSAPMTLSLGWPAIVRMLDQTAGSSCWYMTSVQIWDFTDEVLAGAHATWKTLSHSSGASGVILEQRGGKQREGVDQFTTYRIGNAVDGLLFIGRATEPELQESIEIARQQKVSQSISVSQCGHSYRDDTNTEGQSRRHCWSSRDARHRHIPITSRLKVSLLRVSSMLNDLFESRYVEQTRNPINVLFYQDDTHQVCISLKQTRYDPNNVIQSTALRF